MLRDAPNATKKLKTEQIPSGGGGVRVNSVPSHNFICLRIDCFETNKGPIVTLLKS